MLDDIISNIFSQHNTNKNKQNKVIYYLNMTQTFDNNKYMFENVDLLEKKLTLKLYEVDYFLMHVNDFKVRVVS